MSARYSKEEIAERKISHVWKLWESGRSFASIIGALQEIPENVKFYEGDQWAQPTKATAHMPRPVFNVIKLIVNTIVSNILSVPATLRFIAAEDEVSTEIFTNFAKHILKENKIESLDEQAVFDSAIKKLFCYHVYWDSKAFGKNGKYEGALRIEMIDPLNVFVADPTEKNTQNQEWIIIKKRMQVKAVRELVGDYLSEKEKEELIVSDEFEPIYYNQHEQDGNKYCTVLTRYFRKDGEVYFERAVKGTMLHDPIPLNPALIEVTDDFKVKIKENGDIDVDGNIDSEIEGATSTEVKVKTDDNFKSYLYPLVIGCLEPSNNSIYGLSKVRALIPTQKAINFNMAMVLFNTQQVAWSKYLVKANALRGQEINNVPGQVLYDYSPGNGWGISAMPGVQVLSNGAVELTNVMVGLTRTLTNADEIMTGDMIGKNISGITIELLQQQKNKAVDKEQRRFWRYKEELGLILKQFFITHYLEQEFTFDIGDENWQKLQDISYKTGEKFNRKVKATFRGEDFKFKDIDVVCEAGAGSRYSEILVMQQLESLLRNKLINFKQYVALHPNMSFKGELAAQIRADEQSELNQYKQAYAKAVQIIERLQAQVKQLGGSNEQLNQYIQQLTKQFESRINLANTEIKNMQDFMQNIQGVPINSANQVSKEEQIQQK